jgi:K(+)-stimulated pyrophosphate-energized sodium pump
MNGTEKPEYGRVVDICTRDSLRELVTPGLLAVMAPIAVGFGLGVGALGAYLAGAIGTGTLMAVFLSNSGGAWDNAKKMVEDGHHGGKGAGPAINPLIKVMNLVGLLITPAIVGFALPTQSANSMIIALVATAIIIGALIRNRRQSTSIEY